MKRVLVTGARGFIGSHCLADVLARAHDGRAVSTRDMPSADAIGMFVRSVQKEQLATRRAYAGLRDHRARQVVQNSLRDPAQRIGQPEECIEPVNADIRRCGLIRDADTILLKHAMHLRYANVIGRLGAS